MKTILTEKQITEAGDGHVYLNIEDSRVRFERVRKEGEHDTGKGVFITLLSVIALQAPVYIPISIASRAGRGLLYRTNCEN